MLGLWNEGRKGLWQIIIPLDIDLFLLPPMRAGACFRPRFLINVEISFCLFLTVKLSKASVSMITKIGLATAVSRLDQHVAFILDLLDRERCINCNLKLQLMTLIGTTRIDDLFLVNLGVK